MATDVVGKQGITPVIEPRMIDMKRAKKTKGLQAKHVSSIVPESRVLSGLTLQTLEGPQDLRPHGMVCIGISGETWQQGCDGLLKKYNIVSINSGGWLHCEPKPDREVLAGSVSGSFCSDGKFAIIGEWGEKQSDGTFRQYGKEGDTICQNPEKLTDVWIVAKKIFENSYKFVV